MKEEFGEWSISRTNGY